MFISQVHVNKHRGRNLLRLNRVDLLQTVPHTHTHTAVLLCGEEMSNRYTDIVMFIKTRCFG